MPDGLLVPVPDQSRFPETMVWETETNLSRDPVNFDQLGRIPIHARIVHRFFLTGEGEP